MRPDSSVLLPGFVRRRQEPSIQTVLLCGCGSGFDFVHGPMLWPELRRLGKKVIIGSDSFSDPTKIGNAPTVFEEGQAVGGAERPLGCGSPGRPRGHAT